MSKVKVLFVVGSFYKAGAERFAYEVDSALNKDVFETSIFCLENKNDISKNWFERYYDKKHLELGTSITYADRFRKNNTGLINRVINRIFPKQKSFWKEDLYKYMDGFDVIHWMGEYTYIHTLPDNIRNKSLIQPMSAKFQDRKIYDRFDHELFYNFCSLFTEDEVSYEFSQFKNYHYIVIPLILKIESKINQWEFIDSEIKKIGIFTRLGRNKPLDPFFYSFQLLLDRLPNCELHIYGNGDPKAEGMIDCLERLGIVDKVFFRGHQEDIVKTTIEEKLNLSWFQGYNNDRPAGFAGLDICTTGTPLVCWDFHANPKKIGNPAFPHFKNLNKFVSYSLEILKDKEKAEEISNLQFNETITNRDSKVYIPILEEEYLRIANQ